MDKAKRIAIIGAGNIGTALAEGLVKTGDYDREKIYLTRRHVKKLKKYADKGYKVSSDNSEAVKNSDIIILSVEPQQANCVLEEISEYIDEDKHSLLISVVSSLSIEQINKIIKKDIEVVRAMPNIAITIGESITCLASETTNSENFQAAKDIFTTVGETLVIEEEQMAGATSLSGCGIAFFLRAIRAASQGGIEIGFDSEDALKIASQTAKGAASLLVKSGNHPESEIDKVTTPRGCTIVGLNQMEHDGFSSAMIKGIKVSSDKAEGLYDADVDND